MSYFDLLFIGAVAQLGEHRVCNARVAGSIPVSSTKFVLMFFEIVNLVKINKSNCDIIAFG